MKFVEEDQSKADWTVAQPQFFICYYCIWTRTVVRVVASAAVALPLCSYYECHGLLISLYETVTQAYIVSVCLLSCIVKIFSQHQSNARKIQFHAPQIFNGIISWKLFKKDLAFWNCINFPTPAFCSHLEVWNDYDNAYKSCRSFHSSSCNFNLSECCGYRK